MSWTAQKINKTIIKKKTGGGGGGVEIIGVKKSKVREMSWTAQKINKTIIKKIKKTGGGGVKSPGNVMNCPENPQQFKPWWGGGGVGWKF